MKPLIKLPSNPFKLSKQDKVLLKEMKDDAIMFLMCAIIICFSFALGFMVCLTINNIPWKN